MFRFTNPFTTVSCVYMCIRLNFNCLGDFLLKKVIITRPKTQKNLSTILLRADPLIRMRIAVIFATHNLFLIQEYYKNIGIQQDSILTVLHKLPL